MGKSKLQPKSEKLVALNTLKDLKLYNMVFKREKLDKN